MHIDIYIYMNNLFLMPIAGNNKSSCMRWETEVKEAAENSFRYVSDFLRCLEEEEDDHNQSTSDGRAGNIIIESSRIAHNAIGEFSKLTDLLGDHDYQEERASAGRSEGLSNYGGGKKKKNSIRAGPLPSSGHEGINPKEMLESASSNIQGHGLVMNVFRLVPDDSGIIMNTSSSSSSDTLSLPLPQAAAGSSTWGAGGGGGFYPSTKMLACVEHHRIRSMLSNSKMKCGYMISSTTGSAAGGCNFLMRRLLKQTIRVPAVSDNETDIPVDDYSWRKYGQKPIKGSPHPRSYYRCTIAKGCPARKHVERCVKDPTMLLVTYKGEHDHVQLAVPYSTASVYRP